MEEEKANDERPKALRRKAVQRLSDAAEMPDGSVSDQTARALQELRIHQIELEIQNEELRDAQHQLERSRDRYLQLYHQSSVGYVVADLAGIILHANETAGTLLDRPFSDLLQRPLSEFMHPDDRERFYARYRPFFKNPTGKQIEVRLQPKGARSMHVRITASRSDVPGGLVPNNGEAAQLLIAISDITEQKTAEARIVRAKQQWEQTFDAVPDLIALVDGDLTLRRVNLAFARRLDRSPQACIGEKCYDLLFGKPCPPETCPHARFMDAGHNISSEAYIDRLGGHYLVTATSFTAEKDEAPWTILVFHDITERKMAEKELLRSRNLESIGALAGGIAHDFNNMLTSLVGHIELALFKKEDADGMADHLDKALGASSRIKELANRLLTFSDGGDPRRRSVDIAAMVKEVTLFALSGSNVRPEFDIRSAFPPVAVDEPQLTNAFQSIITNAREAMPAGGTLHISVTARRVHDHGGGPLRPGAYVEIQFKDQGSGINGEDLDKVFDPYFTTKSMGAEKGMGLGLAITYSVIRQHRGHLDIDSGNGKGTVVKIYLPISLAGEASGGPQPLREAAEVTGSPRFLVMDDETVLWEMMEMMFESLKCQVDFAADGAEALTLFDAAIEEGRPYAGAFLDLTIRGGHGGKAVIREIRKRDPHISAIAFSGYTTDPIFEDPQAFGFSGVLKKPFQMDEFSAVIVGLLDSGAPLN